MRGALIVIEGLDRAGKSTQCERLCESLSQMGHAVELLKFPDRTTAIGRMIDAYLTSDAQLSDQAIHLLFSANRWELAETMLSKLKKGTTLLLDRYVFSGVAFTAAKGVDPGWCRGPDVGLPQPDVVLFLNVSPQIAAARGGYGDERYENADFQAKVRQEFARFKQLSYWREFDADKSTNEVASDLLAAACEFKIKGEEEPKVLGSNW